MKLFNPFKKESSKNSNSKNASIQKLEKNQLEKVIGGDGDTTPDETKTKWSGQHIDKPTLTAY